MFERLADIAGRRERAWSVLALAFATPTPTLVDAMRSRSVFRDLAAGIGWLDSDRDGFTPHVAALDAIAQRADRDPSALLEELRAEHRIGLEGPDGARVRRLIGAMTVMCESERAAWAAGEIAQAKALRRREHAFLHDPDGEPVAPLCARIRRSGGSGFYPAAAGLLEMLLRTEGGGDYAGSVVRGVFPDGGA